MASRETRASIFNRNKIHSHFPLAKSNYLLNQELLGGSMKVVTHPAIPAFIPIHMQLMKVPVTVPEISTPLGSLRIHQICVMTLKTEFEILCLRFQIIFRRKLFI